MKKFMSWFGVLALALVGTLVGIWQPQATSAASVDNFYFKDFTADYYLSQDAEVGSRLKVVESLTAMFPSYAQNKGICRNIPFSNQGGLNITLTQLGRGDITVKRNGATEPIYSIDHYKDYYRVCTGTEDYVMGEQTYTFTYEFSRVVTDFEKYQELYWDTNGTGWAQRFDSVTARVHFADAATAAAYDGNAWCYVGKYGENNQSRCTITKITDGVEFTTSNLAAYENLTFDVQFKPGAFYVPEPAVEQNYILVWVLVGAGVLCGLITIVPIRKFLATREKARYYKGHFVKPEYQPSHEYSLTELAQIYIGRKEHSKVAVLLELVVKKHVSLVKLEDSGLWKPKWAVHIDNLDGVPDEARTVLMILNGGKDVSVGDEIKLQQQIATSATVQCGRKFDQLVLADLRRDGLVEEKCHPEALEGYFTAMSGVVYFVIGFFALMGGLWLRQMVINDMLAPGQVAVGENVFLPVLAGMLVVTVSLCVALRAASSKYECRTMKGLAASRYMDGLKLYIKMAEAERMDFLQSVKGVDTSPKGIVKLYEKLLPYAAVFGLEKSWMNELEKYYNLAEIERPYWCNTDTLMATRLASNYVSSASSMNSGSSSSGSSGGGGGGFSGGGGGGGGGGGR